MAKGIAVLTLPLYTRHVARAEYGASKALLTAVILASIVLRAGRRRGVRPLLLRGRGRGAAGAHRAHRDGDRGVDDDASPRWRRSSSRAPLSRLLLGFDDPELSTARSLGLWAFTNLEMAYAQLRVDERARAYMFASGANVAMTVVFTVALVVFAGQGARGLLLGNFGASALVVLGLWWVLRRRFSLRVRLADLRAMLRFGLPTVPADASVYALQVVDRFYLFRAYSHARPGEYSVALQLATVVFVFVRGFQYAWPPLAYSIESDREAARLYSLVTTYFVLAHRGGRRARWRCSAAGWCGCSLAPEYFGAYTRAAVAGARLGAVRALPGVDRDHRPRARDPAQPPAPRWRGSRSTWRCCSCWCPPRGLGLGIAGAGLALCGAYAAMLVGHAPAHARRCSRSASSGCAWRSCARSSRASRSRASCCCPTPASPASRCGWRGWR